jgi:predicted nucleic acid-binding protein
MPDSRVVVDASVAVKWYVPETGSRQAAAMLGEGMPLLAPDLLLAEFGNTVWKKTRRGELTPDEGMAIVRAFLSTLPVTLHPSTVLLPGAWEIAVKFGRTIYDALYLALAVAEDCPLITADERLAQAIRTTTLSDFVKPLSSWISSQT